MQSITEISGTPDQCKIFAKRIKQPADRIALDVLDAMGLEGLPIQFEVSPWRAGLTLYSPRKKHPTVRCEDEKDETVCRPGICGPVVHRVRQQRN